MAQVEHIVIAEDDADDIKLFQDAVDENCPTLKLTIAEDGEKLLKVLDEVPRPDLIVLDLNMPRINGKECLLSIRESKKYDNVDIMILTTSNNKNEIDYCMKHGADHYIVKPQHLGDLNTLIKNICAGKMRKRA